MASTPTPPCRKRWAARLARCRAWLHAWLHARFDPIIAALDRARSDVRAGDRDARSHELETLAAGVSGATPAPAALAIARSVWRCGQRDAASTRAAALVPVPAARRGRESPHREAGARPRRRAPRAIDGARRHLSRTRRRTSKPRGSWRRCSTRPASRRALNASDSAVAELDPFDRRRRQCWAAQALAGGDAANAARWFRAALAAGPRDRVGGALRPAQRLSAAGRTRHAKRQTLAALEVAPTYARAQDLLLAIVDGSRDGAAAVVRAASLSVGGLRRRVGRARPRAAPWVGVRLAGVEA